MAEAAPRRMTLGEFLAWNGEPERHYELIGGIPIAMTPPVGRHQILVGRLALALGEAARTRRPCEVRSQAGIVLPDRNDTYYEADLAVSCAGGDLDSPMVKDPILIVEVLSPTTEEQDRKVKLPDYRSISSVREVVLIDPRRVYCEVHRCLEGDRWLTDLLRDPSIRLRLEGVGLDVALSALYEDLIEGGQRDERVDG